MFQIQNSTITINSTVLGYIGDFPITNTMTMAVFNLIVFILLAIAVSKFKVINPGKFQIAVEGLVQTITGLIDQVTGDAKISKKIMPLVFSLVLFIMISNIINTFLPILSGFTYNQEALFRSHTNDFNTTLALAVGMIVIAQFYTIKQLNIFGYFFKFIQIKQIIVGFSKGIGSGFIAIINAFVGLLDIVSEFAKIISLSLRLFGNMFAGEVLLAIFMSLFALAIPIPIMGLSTLSGVIQSIVFGSLVASFFTGVLKEED